MKRYLVALLAAACSVAEGASVPGTQTTSNMTLYVNAATGVDTNPCTLAKPCKTFARADGLVPYRVAHTINFVVAIGTYGEVLPANHLLVGSGTVQVNGASYAGYSSFDGGVGWAIPPDAGTIGICDSGTCVVDGGSTQYITFTGGVSIPGTQLGIAAAVVNATTVCLGSSGCLTAAGTAPACDAGTASCTTWSQGICTAYACNTTATTVCDAGGTPLCTAWAGGACTAGTCTAKGATLTNTCDAGYPACTNYSNGVCTAAVCR